MDQATPRSICETKLQTQALTRLLLTAQVGQIITYAELNAVCGMDVQTEARGYLYTARKNAEAQLNCLFDTVIDVGLKRLAPHEYHAVGEKARHSMRRKAKRTFRRLSRMTAEEYQALPPESRAALDVERTLAMFSGRALSEASRKKALGMVESTGQRITFQKTLELFRKK
jgi:hypothetical protein